MLDLDDPRWQDLCGGDGTPYDASGIHQGIVLAGANFNSDLAGLEIDPLELASFSSVNRMDSSLAADPAEPGHDQKFMLLRDHIGNVIASVRQHSDQGSELAPQLIAAAHLDSAIRFEH